MKNLRITFIQAAILSISISCSDKPSNEVIKNLITEHEKSRSTKDKNYIEIPCGFSKAIEVPKVFKYSTFDYDKELTTEMQNQKKVLETISLNGIVTMTKTKDESDFVPSLGLRVNQEYDINLTSEGSRLKIGETGDAYVLNMFDVSSIEILKEDFRASDTLLVTYSLTKTPLYRALAEVCENRNDNYLLKGDSSFIKLVYRDKVWKVNK